MLRDILIQKGLSNREAEVAELVSRGLSNKEVANQLFVTEKTVKFHLTNIYKKMNVKSRAQLIVWCLPHLGFIESEARMEAQSTTNGAAFGVQTTAQQAPAVQQTITLPSSNVNTVAMSAARDSGNSDVGTGI